MKERIEHDLAVSSVIGEMIMIALVIILVALFASSVFSLIPGERDATVDIAMKSGAGDSGIIFWHKGGDWVQKKDLTVVVLDKDGGRKEYPSGSVPIILYNVNNDETMTFDLGGRLEVSPVSELKKGDMIRVLTRTTVIYSGEI
ncbi:type IV pilin N-terminal domain-containing protein [Methanocalculus sp.]|uniref:type IV pilin N-terminal domain-containing protein n=1 Tax=Methanocalculus sp. TaxID=2004547 RepID=UPI0027243E93|nr:type IV pilin N-terminal domain-containing protein [Methanocalculus sp.]MDO8841293.1 type IV pilin N-terminal domain-containing protein [Methanocalculus sp.]